MASSLCTNLVGPRTDPNEVTNRKILPGIDPLSFTLKQISILSVLSRLILCVNISYHIIVQGRSQNCSGKETISNVDLEEDRGLKNFQESENFF
jgi:hypothetical protein